MRPLEAKDLVPAFEDTYFNIQEEEKFFIAKLPLHLQLAHLTGSSKSGLSLNKYLVNKHNIAAEYHYFEPADSQSNENSGDGFVELAQKYFEKL